MPEVDVGVTDTSNLDVILLILEGGWNAKVDSVEVTLLILKGVDVTLLILEGGSTANVDSVDVTLFISGDGSTVCVSVVLTARPAHTSVNK